MQEVREIEVEFLRDKIKKMEAKHIKDIEYWKGVGAEYCEMAHHYYHENKRLRDEIANLKKHIDK